MTKSDDGDGSEEGTCCLCTHPDQLESVTLVEFLLRFDHLGKVVREGGEVYERPNRGICGINPIYHYDVTKSDDGVGGEEGTFCLCTLWYAA